MKKPLLTFVTFVILAFVAPISAYAAYYVAEPEDGQYQPGSTVPVVIKAGSDFTQNEASGMTVYIELEGDATIVPGSLSIPLTTPNGSKYLVFGMCDNNRNIVTTTKFCGDFGVSGGELVTAGETLASFRVQLGSEEGTARVVLTEENAITFVEDGEQALDQDRLLAEFEISENAPSPTPITPVTAIGDSPVALILGFLVISLGAGFYVWRNKTASV